MESEFGFEVQEKNSLNTQCWINKEYDEKLQEYLDLQARLNELRGPLEPSGVQSFEYRDLNIT